MNKEKPKVSVIICAYTIERLNNIYEAVNSVLAQTFRPYEVMLAVDHNQELHDKLQKELPQPTKLLLNDGDERGAVATDNVGIAYSSGDIIAFIDDDAVAEKDWLEKLVKYYDDPSIVAVGGKLVSVWERGRPEWFPEELDWIVGGTYKGHPEIQTPVRNLILCNMSVRSAVFHDSGFFATEFGRNGNWGTGAESEFFLRVRHQQSNTIVLYEPDAIVYHKVPPRRTSLKYVVLRSYNEGFHKARIERSRVSLSQNPLLTERSYLHYLLFTSVPQRLTSFYKKGSLSQIVVIVLSIAATGVGYLVGKLRRKSKTEYGH